MSKEPAEEEVEVEDEATEEHDNESAESAAEAEEDEVEEEELTGVQPGDVIRVNLTAYTAEEGILVDTTDQEVAEEEGVDQDQTFEPRVVVLGEGHLFAAVEEALTGLEAGEATEVTVEAAAAFGEHDPDQVRTVGVDKIPDDDRYPGAFIEVDGQRGMLETIIGGRARVDFNHPFAGDDIDYDLEVIEVLDDREELAQGLIQTFLDLDLDIWFQTDEIEVYPGEEDEDDEAPEVEEVESLYIEATPQLTMNQQWLFGKQQIASELIDQLEIDRIVVQEIIESTDNVLQQTQDLLAEEGLEGLEEEDIEELEELEE